MLEIVRMHNQRGCFLTQATINTFRAVTKSYGIPNDRLVNRIIHGPLTQFHYPVDAHPRFTSLIRVNAVVIGCGAGFLEIQ